MKLINPRELSAAEQRKLAPLMKERAAWHWGEPATKVIRIDDPFVPDVTDCGPLVELVTDRGAITIPEGCWLAYEPRHPRQRLHIISSAAFRERVRNDVKHARGLLPLQEIAEATGGDQADYALPNIMAAPLGVLEAVTYHTKKKGEQGGLSYDYQHEFGKEHSKGCKPYLAADVSGRLWVAGGSYRSPYPGITG
jgi:hypothetical protein